MNRLDAAKIISGVGDFETKQASAPTNVHIITGEVGATSEDGKVTVAIDGLVFSDDEEQFVEFDTLGGLEEGDTATILLTGESGHAMVPLAIGGVGTVDRIVERVGQLYVDYAEIGELVAEKATISDLNAATARIDDLEADTADISDLVATKATISDLNAATARIDDLEADTADISDLVATKAAISDLNAATARIGDLEADHVSVSDFQAEQANIDSLQAATADISTIRANSAKVANLTAQELEADHATIAALDSNYVTTDFLNADVGWIENGVIKDGSISSAMINSLSANKLSAGTINGSVITVTNLNADNITTGTINGQRIGEGSLSLDKLSEDVYTEAEVNSIVDGLNDRIDGAIETFTGTAVPTLNNQPASSWNTTKLRDEHVGNVYYVVNSQSQQNGYCYRFTKSGSSYSWQLIKDSDVTAALSRLSTAEGKITTFDSDISKLKTDTGTLTTRTTNLETRADDVDATLLDKVDVTTFNEVSDTVDSHTQTISQHTTAISNKADSSTVTAVTNRVSKNEQDISGINTTIGELQDTVETKADGSTVSTISNKLNTVSDTVDGHTQTLTSVQNTLSTKADSSTVSTLQQDYATFKQTTQNFESTVGTTYATKTELQTTDDKIENLEIGGRNLALNTAGVIIDRTESPDGSRYEYSYFDLGRALPFGADTPIVISFDLYMPIKSSSPRLLVYNSNRKGPHQTLLDVNVLAGRSLTVGSIVDERIVIETSVASDRSDATLPHDYLEFYSNYGSNNFYRISNLKLEKGTKPTDWTPAPEDIDAAIDKVDSKTSVRLHLRRDNWTDAQWGTYASVGHANYFSNTHIASDGTVSATGFDASTLNVGDLIVVEGISTGTSIPYSATAQVTSVPTSATGYIPATVISANNAKAIESRVTTAESSITQNARNIELKVSETDVTGNYLVGKINLDSTTVKIDADRVEIDGTAIFSAISSDVDEAITDKGYQTSSQVESAITSKGYATTTQAQGYASTAQSNAISAAAADATTKANTAESNAKRYADDIEVGGRNLVAYSGTGKNWSYSTFVNGVYTRSTTATSESYVTGRTVAPLELGETYTLSAWMKTNGQVSSVDMFLHDRAVKTIRSKGLGEITTEWVFYTLTVTMPDSWVSGTNTVEQWIVRFDNNGSKTSGTEAILYVREPKLERGNRATDWTPAPEDISDEVDGVRTTANAAAPKANAVARSQRIYYRKTSSGAPSTPGTASSNWVTKADDGNDAWTKMHIAINSTHKYIYTCEQYEMADGTVGYTSVLLDNTITVIDGGNIITGSVTANKLNAADINASKSLTVGAMTDAAASTILNSNVVVGGRNLLPWSSPSAENLAKVASPTTYNSFVTEDGYPCYKITSASTNGAQYASNGKRLVKLIADTTYTYSAWVKVTTTGSDTSVSLNFSSLGHFTVYNSASAASDKAHEDVAAKRIYSPDTVTIGEWTNITLTFTTNSLDGSTFGVYPKHSLGDAYTVYIRDQKLEKGNKATDWTPAPEDVSNEIDGVRTTANAAAPKANAVARTQRIYYRKTSSGAPAANTIWLATSGTGYGNWSLKIPPLTTGTGTSVIKYPYLYTAVQTQTVAQQAAGTTCSCSTVLIDDTSTVIDGGNIITGTVSANAINATSGTFAQANIPALTADHIKANVISAVNNGTGTINADKINVSGITIGYDQVEDTPTIPSTVAELSDASDYAKQSALTAEINQRKAAYATSSTAAGTQGKVANCANFALYTGASVTVTFSNANTHATPTLNVNSTGAKSIRGYTGAELTAAEYKWAAGAAITFVYDGSYWRMQDGGAQQAKADAASSASAASTSATNAATSASNASTSATNAANSASTASTKAGEASTSATNAASSASTASSKATDASNSASAASTSATNAANSATSASNSASSASTSATNAATSATKALDAAAGWYAECSTDGATTAKVATITPATTNFTLTKGVVVHVKFSNLNSGATGSLTLNVNSTGAKSIKYISSGGTIANLADANWLRANVTYEFYYDGTYWIAQQSYNTNNYDRENYKAELAASTAISSGRIAVLGTDGKLKLLNASAFDYSGPILYVATAYSADDVSDGTKRTTNYTFWGTTFTLTNTHSIANAAAGSAVYIVGTVSGKTFTPNSTVLTCKVPTTKDNLVYIRLGLMSSTTAAVLEADHPMYMFFNGAFQQCDAATADAACTATNYITHVDNNGITIHPQSGTSNRVAINADGMEVFKGNVSVASYGDTARIGKQAGPRVVVETSKLSMYAGSTGETLAAEIKTFVDDYEGVHGEISTDFIKATTFYTGGGDATYLSDGGLYIHQGGLAIIPSMSFGTLGYQHLIDGINFGFSSATTNSNGITTFNPDLGVKPTAVFVAPGKASNETEAVAKIAVPMVWSIDSATQVQVRWQHSDTNAWLASNAVGWYWLALYSRT